MGSEGGGEGKPCLRYKYQPGADSYSFGPQPWVEAGLETPLVPGWNDLFGKGGGAHSQEKCRREWGEPSTCLPTPCLPPPRLRSALALVLALTLPSQELPFLPGWAGLWLGWSHTNDECPNSECS